MASHDIDTPILPTSNDVLCGKGIICSEHAGNLRFQAIIQKHVPMYAKCKRAGKSAIVREIINDITVHNNGRFLRKAHGCRNVWHDADERAVREKVGHALRDAAAMYIKKQCNGRAKTMKSHQMIHKRGQGSTRTKTMCDNKTGVCLSHQTTHMATTNRTAANESFSHEQPQQHKPLGAMLSSNQENTSALSFEEPIGIMAQWAEAFLDSSTDMNTNTTTNTNVYSPPTGLVPPTNKCQQRVSPTTSNDGNNSNGWSASFVLPFGSMNEHQSAGFPLEAKHILSNDTDDEAEAMYQELLRSLYDETPHFESLDSTKDIDVDDFDHFDLCKDL